MRGYIYYRTGAGVLTYELSEPPDCRLIKVNLHRVEVQVNVTRGH